MSLAITTRMLVPLLGQLSDAELDTIPYGVVQLDLDGRVLTFNRAEADDLGWTQERPIGRDYFNDVAPSTFVAEVFGRHVEAFMSHQLDDVFRFTFSHTVLPRSVLMRMYYSARTGTIWIFTANPDGSSLGSAALQRDRRDDPPARVA